jgi:crotonobetainyl-CoA:carnitine CoA-transferase CaiB-like acyl-CoA transferase
LATHPEFAQRENRIKNYVKLRAELAKTFITRRRSEWTSRLETADVPHAPVYNIPEVFDDPQVKHLDTFYRLQHPTEGDVWGIKPPVFFDGQRPGTMTPPPVVGEHTEAILSELGQSVDAIKMLKETKIV